MFKNSFLFGFLFLILMECNPGLYAQDTTPAKLQFENPEVLLQFDKDANSKIALSDTHYHFGKKSLQWDFKKSSYLQTHNFKILSEAESPLAYGDYFPNSPTLVLSIYNEQIQAGSLRIAYGDQADEEEVWFDIPLDFTGWRTVWVPFYEMQGNTPQPNTQINFTSFKIQAIDVVEGRIFLDDLVFSQYQDDRYAYPDFLVPFIKKNFAPERDHWMPSLAYYDNILKLPVKSLSQSRQAELDTIEARLQARLKSADTLDDKLAYANQLYQKLALVEEETIKGRPITFRNSETYFDKTPKYDEDYIEVHRFGQIMLQLAQIYSVSDAVTQAKIADYFTTATRYFLDQGWQAGASGGTRHHIGYSLEDIAVAFFIMRKPLEDAQLLNDVGASMQWVFNLGKILADEKDFVANIDYFNTQSFYHLMIIYMRTDPEQIAALLEHYSKYMSITLAQDDAHGVFKVDGTSWHHGGHYPAYGMGAFKNLPKVFRTLAGTHFQIGTAGHKNFKKALLTTRLYSNTYDFGFANAGRHPLEDNSIEFLQPQFLDMVFSGNPEHTAKVDADFGSAYLRLWGNEDAKNKEVLTNHYNLKPEQLPGYHTLPYAATAIHRRNTWVAILKGYSKYVWASEIYIASNRYGRYPANGTIQLLSEKGEEQSGYSQLGWDWNRYPGATIINLPLDKLESDLSLLMFKSNQTFAGAVQQDDNGVFAMILDESRGSNADGQRGAYGFSGKLKAHKSVFSFGDKLICIGSDISSVDANHDVETVLFQNNLEYATQHPFSKYTGTLDKSPLDKHWETSKQKDWLIDAFGNAYHILSDNSVHLKQGHQQSYHNKYSINTGKMNPKGNGVKETEGDYAVAWINHGKAPQQANYQYVIYPFIGQERIRKIQTGAYKDVSFKIKRADNQAHIVYDKISQSTGYAIYDASLDLKEELLQKVSLPSLILIKEVDKKTRQINIVQPDLNFYDKMGDYTNGLSHPLPLKFKLKGKWNIVNKTKEVSIEYSKKHTIVHVNSTHGKTYDYIFVKNY